jgi:hypothetical protein
VSFYFFRLIDGKKYFPHLTPFLSLHPEFLIFFFQPEGAESRKSLVLCSHRAILSDHGGKTHATKPSQIGDSRLLRAGAAPPPPPPLISNSRLLLSPAY